jgi:hypothetical protein
VAAGVPEFQVSMPLRWTTRDQAFLVGSLMVVQRPMRGAEQQIPMNSKDCCGNSIRLLGAYAPSTQKTYFEILKKLTKNFTLHIHNLSVFVMFCQKDMFCGLCKKEKNSHVKCLIFSIKFIFFTHVT